MKKRRLKKSIKLFFIFILVISFLLFSYLFFIKDNSEKPVDSQTPSDNPNNGESTDNPFIENPTTEITYLNKVTYTKDLDDEKLKVIVDFLDTYYKSIKELKEYDMTKYFVSSTSEDALINQTALSLLIDIRKLKPNDLRMTSAKYDIDIINVVANDDEVDIELLENSYVRFAFMNDIESKVYNVKNKFKLKKVNGEYKIANYSKVKDFYVMITDKYKSGGQSQLDEIKNDYLSIVNKKIVTDRSNYQNFLNNTGITRKTCDHDYDRSSALNYALNWVNKRNSEWTTFSSNCQNYASQVVYNGGVIMDYTGNANNNLQWKFYSSFYNVEQKPSGYVYTWTYVPYFYEYAKNNTGSGLCADVDVNLYYAEAGDIIHVGTSGPTRHALVVIGSYKKDGQVVDILVNSNTVDLENYPISAYAYPYISLIKVYGWND